MTTSNTSLKRRSYRDQGDGKEHYGFCDLGRYAPIKPEWRVNSAIHTPDPTPPQHRSMANTVCAQTAPAMQVLQHTHCVGLPGQSLSSPTLVIRKALAQPSRTSIVSEKLLKSFLMSQKSHLLGFHIVFPSLPLICACFT